jgi:hypothetical protein
MTDIIIPNTFADKIGTTNLSGLDENFTYIASAIASGAGGTINFDGGSPTTVYTGSSVKLDCGGVS